MHESSILSCLSMELIHYSPAGLNEWFCGKYTGDESQFSVTGAWININFHHALTDYVGI